jgi:hypothetical protein
LGLSFSFGPIFAILGEDTRPKRDAKRLQNVAWAFLMLKSTQLQGAAAAPSIVCKLNQRVPEGVR